MMGKVPRPCVDEPLVASRETDSPHLWGRNNEVFKLVVLRDSKVDKATPTVLQSQKPNQMNPPLLGGRWGSSARKELFSLLYGSLADDEIIEMFLDAAQAAGVENLARLRAELAFRLDEYRSLEQYGSLDTWDDDTS